MKEDFKSIPRNQELLKMILISWRNRKLKWREVLERKNRDFELNLMKLNPNLNKN